MQSSTPKSVTRKSRRLQCVDCEIVELKSWALQEITCLKSSFKSRGPLGNHDIYGNPWKLKCNRPKSACCKSRGPDGSGPLKSRGLRNRGPNRVGPGNRQAPKSRGLKSWATITCSEIVGPGKSAAGPGNRGLWCEPREISRLEITLTYGKCGLMERHSEVVGLKSVNGNPHVDLGNQ